MISPANIPVVVDRDLAIGSRLRSHLREIAPDRDRCRRNLAFERSHRIEIAVDASRDRAFDRNLVRSRSRSTARSRDGAISIFARSRSMARSCEASIAISDCGRRTGAREIGADWSSEFAGDRRTDWNVSSPLARARARSLSLIFRKYFEGKIEV